MGGRDVLETLTKRDERREKRGGRREEESGGGLGKGRRGRGERIEYRGEGNYITIILIILIIG